MTNKRNSLIFFTLALLLGLGAAFLAQRWASQRLADAQEQASHDVTRVIVAARVIEFGNRIETDQIKEIDWPVNAVPEGAFHTAEDVVGKLSKYHILPGEPILELRIADPLKSPLLAGLIEMNKRAVTVRVDDVVGVAGFLLPGSRVDVLASQKIEQQPYQTRTLLHNLKVLAVDQTASASGEDKPVVVRAVTLEADPEQAEKLVQATLEGSVQLALRNPADHAMPEAMPVPAVMKAKPRPVSPHRTTSHQVMVIRGTQVGNDSAQR